jgi:uncharacterized membrane protein
MSHTRAMIIVGLLVAVAKLALDAANGVLNGSELVALPLVALVLFAAEGFRDDLTAGLKRG